MKRFLIIAMIFSLFVSCKQATIDTVGTPSVGDSTDIQTTDGVRYVKNSEWKACSLSYLTAKTSSRAAEAEISESDLETIVKTLNSEEDDNQYFITETDTDITESPTVTIYYAKAVDGYYEIVQKVENADRAWFVGYRQTFASEAEGMGCVLFVDKVPETAPIPVVDTRTRHEKYSLYMINKYDKIVVYQGYKYEQHIDEIWDTLSDDVKSGYNNDIDIFMKSRVDGFETDLRCVGLVPDDAPWRVVSGQIYTEPTE